MLLQNSCGGGQGPIFPCMIFGSMEDASMYSPSLHSASLPSPKVTRMASLPSEHPEISKHPPVPPNPMPKYSKRFPFCQVWGSDEMGRHREEGP